MSTDLSTTIETAATTVRRMRTDAGETEEQPLPDLIAADKYLRSKAVAGAGVNPFAKLKTATIAFGTDA